MHFLLGQEIHLYQDESASRQEERRSIVWRVHMKFDRQFEKMQHHYKRVLEWCLENSALTLVLFGLLVGGELAHDVLYRQGLLSICGLGADEAAC